MISVRTALFFTAVLMSGFAGPAAAERNPSCTYFGSTFCLRLGPGSQVQFSFPADFFIHRVTTRDPVAFAIYEGDYPSIDSDKCKFSPTGDFGKKVPACSYLDDDNANFVFRLNEENEDQVLPTMLHIWFPGSKDEEQAREHLKTYLIIE